MFLSPGKILEKSWEFVSEKGYEPWISQCDAGHIHGLATLNLKGFLKRRCMGISPGQNKVTVIMRWLY